MHYALHTGDNVQVLRDYVADSTVQLTVTSPPYDDLRAYNGFSWDFEALARELVRVTRPGGVVVWVVADATVNGSETGTSFEQALFFKSVGFNLHDTMLYRSAKPPLNSNRYQHEFEYMFVCSKGKPSVFNPLKEPCIHAGKKQGHRTFRQTNGSLKDAGSNAPVKPDKLRGNIWTYVTGGFCSPDDARGHPAIFPEGLAGDHIASWSNPGDLVLDPFLGSGTTGKMAVLAGRDFVGCDISAEYIRMSRERIARALHEPPPAGAPCEPPEGTFPELAAFFSGSERTTNAASARTC